MSKRSFEERAFRILHFFCPAQLLEEIEGDLMQGRKSEGYERPFPILHFFCPAQLLEEIEGDLMQGYQRDLQLHGHLKWPGDSTRFRAKRRLLWNVICYFMPGILIRNKCIFRSGHLRMLSNYFKTTYRYSGRNKLSFGFRLGGLTLALFSSLIIA